MIRTVTSIGPYRPRFIDNGPKTKNCILLPVANKKVHVFCHLTRHDKYISGEVLAHDDKTVMHWICRGKSIDYHEYQIGQLTYHYLREENTGIVNANLEDLVMKSIQEDLDLSGDDLYSTEDMFIEGDTVDMVPPYNGVIFEHL